MELFFHVSIIKVHRNIFDLRSNNWSFLTFFSWPGQCLEISVYRIQEWGWHFLDPLPDNVAVSGFAHFLYGICNWAVHEIRTCQIVWKYRSNFFWNWIHDDSPLFHHWSVLQCDHGLVHLLPICWIHFPTTLG